MKAGEKKIDMLIKCKECGKEISDGEAMHNKGLCTKCYSTRNENSNVSIWKSYLIIVGLILFILLLTCAFTIKKDDVHNYNSLIQNNNKTSNINNYNTTYSSSADSEYCEAYGCARKKASGSSKYCSIHMEDPNAETPVAQPKSSSSSSTYSNYHKCEYNGCSNYASGTKYCSKHNQTKCSRAGCSNKEAYQGAGLCKEHLYESIQNY